MTDVPGVMSANQLGMQGLESAAIMLMCELGPAQPQCHTWKVTKGQS